MYVCTYVGACIPVPVIYTDVSTATQDPCSDDHTPQASTAVHTQRLMSTAHTTLYVPNKTHNHTHHTDNTLYLCLHAVFNVHVVRI